MGEVTPAELSARLSEEGEDPLVLDVRPAAAFEDWHVPGSFNLDIADDLSEVPNIAKEALSSLPEDREVILVCTAGEPAVLAADHLRGMEYDVKTLTCQRP